MKNGYLSTEYKVSAFEHVFPTVCFQFVTHSPGPSQPSPALPSASSVSHNAAAPYESTNTEMLENSRLFQKPLFSTLQSCKHKNLSIEFHCLKMQDTVKLWVKINFACFTSW